MSRISGPLLDLHIEAPAVKYEELSNKAEAESSQQIRQRVVAARRIQMKRFTGRSEMYGNADMQSKEIQTFCKLDIAGEDLLKMAITMLGLSARAYDRILKVGRTIADLAHETSLKPEHIPPKRSAGRQRGNSVQEFGWEFVGLSLMIAASA